MPKSHKVATRNLLNGKERELKLKHKQQHSTDKKRERREKWTQRLTHFYDKPVPPKVIEMDMSAMEDVLLSIPVESNSKYDNINVIVDYKIAAIKSTLQSKRPISQKALRKSK